MPTSDIKDKIPMPEKPTLFLPMSFWSQILVTIDKKIQLVSQQYGYGKVQLSITIHRGKIVEVSFDDNVRIRDFSETLEGKPEILDKKNDP